jgi:hypothetical protein
VVKVKGTGRHKMRCASWQVRATGVVTQHNETQAEHAGLLSVHCSVNVPGGSVIGVCVDGDVRVLEG